MPREICAESIFAELLAIHSDRNSLLNLSVKGSLSSALVS